MGGLSPQVQGYNQWNQGRMAASLPRPFSIFSDATLGPGFPIIGPGINEPNDDGLTDPRRYQFQVNWNMPIGVPGSEAGSAKLASFENLRNICELYSVAQACINLRISEMRGLEWDIVPTEDAEKAMRASPTLHADFQKRRAQALRFFKRPDTEYADFSSWFAAVIYEVLTVDALALYLWPTKAKRGGLLGSNLGELALIDGTSIKPLRDVYGNTPKPPNVAYQQYMYGVPRTDLMTVADPDLIELDNDENLRAQYRSNQLLYLPYCPRVRTPYGLPPIERALIPAMAGLNRQQYQLDYFSEGSIPGVFISPGDANMTMSQMRTLQDSLNALAGDPAWKHKIIVLPPGSAVDPQKPIDLANQFDEVVMSQVTMAFDVMPMELGLSPKVSTTQSVGAANQMAKASQDINQRKAMKPLLLWFKSVIFDNILQNVCGQADMEWKWQGLEQGLDEETKLNVLKNKISIGLMSVDEGRVELGLQPWGLPVTSDPGILIQTGFVPLGAIDPTTGEPIGRNQPTSFAELEGTDQKPNPDSSDGGSKPASNPQVARPNQSSSPSHSAAQTSTSEADRNVGSKPGPGEGTAKTKAALAELDQLRRRLKQGKDIGDWVPKAISRGVLQSMQFDLTLGTDMVEIIDKARAATLEEHAQFQRRQHALDSITRDTASRLGKLANGVRTGRIAAPQFISGGVDALKDGIAAGYRIGASHALSDRGHPGHRLSKAESDDAEEESYDELLAAVSSYWDKQAADAVERQRPYLERFARDLLGTLAVVGGAGLLGARLDLYSKTVMSAYERSYAVTGDAASQVDASVSGDSPVTLADGTVVEPGTQIITWNSTNDEACGLCSDRNGEQYTMETLPGFPGDGGFGDLCEGGPNCLCFLTFEDATDGAKVSDAGSSSDPYRLGQLDGLRQIFTDALPAADQARVQAAQDARDQMMLDMGAHEHTSSRSQLG